MVFAKKRAHFSEFEDKGGGGGGGGGRHSENCLEKTKYEHYLFIKHP